jgi:hypothetical protein
MQHSGVIQGAGVTRHEVPLLARFLGKLVLEVLPAALASVIGGFLFTQYQFGHPAAPQPVAEEAGPAAPASAEMMQVVRDEHAMILDFLKARRAAEKSRLAAAEEEDANAAANARRTAAARRAVAALVAAKPAAARNKATRVVAAVPHTPLVIARVEHNESAPPAQASAPDHASLVAKTLAIKDHAVSATLRVVSAIGGIPSWIASIGDRSGGADTDTGERQFTGS